MEIAVARLNRNYQQKIAENRDFIEHLMTILPRKYSDLFLQTLRDPKGTRYALPLPTLILLQMDDIVRDSTPYQQQSSIDRQINPVSFEPMVTPGMIYKFVNFFVDHEQHVFPQALYYIPKFNLHHYGNICHLNTCLLMLASLFDVMNTLVSLGDSLPYEITTLKQILLSSYSPIDMSPKSLMNLIDILKININNIIPAEETMYDLVDILTPFVPKDILINWNYLHTNIQEKELKDASLKEIVDKYAPKYLLVNAQDFSVDNEIQCNHQFILDYFSKDHDYKLASVIVHKSNHFINVFFNGDEVIVKDDLCHRFARSNIDVTQLGRNIQITQCCYVKVK